MPDFMQKDADEVCGVLGRGIACAETVDGIELEPEIHFPFLHHDVFPFFPDDFRGSGRIVVFPVVFDVIGERTCQDAFFKGPPGNGRFNLPGSGVAEGIVPDIEGGGDGGYLVVTPVTGPHPVRRTVPVAEERDVEVLGSDFMGGCPAHGGQGREARQTG